MPISPRKVWKNSFFSYQGGLSWHLRALHCKFQMYEDHRSRWERDYGLCWSRSNTRAFLHELLCFAVRSLCLHQHIHIASCAGLYCFPHTGCYRTLNHFGLCAWSSNWGRTSRSKRIKLSFPAWKFILLIKSGLRTYTIGTGATAYTPVVHMAHTFYSISCMQAPIPIPLYYRLVGSYFPLSWWVALLLSGCSFWWC